MLKRKIKCIVIGLFFLNGFSSLSAQVVAPKSKPAVAFKPSQKTYLQMVYGDDFEKVTDEMKEVYLLGVGLGWDISTHTQKKKFLLLWHKNRHKRVDDSSESIMTPKEKDIER